MSRALPSGGSIDVSKSFRQLKVVDRSNANAKFSKRPMSRNTESQIFQPEDTTPVVERPPPKPTHADPLLGGEEQVAKKTGVRITNMDVLLKEREEYNYNHQRQLRKTVTPPADHTPANAAFTAFGQCYRGKAVVVLTNKESEPAKDRNERSMERFRLTPRTANNVLLPQTLEDTTPKPKPQRFSASQRHSSSLVGVLSGHETQRAPTYKLQAPWHTDS